MNNANVPRNFNATVIWARYKFANALFSMGWQITVWDVSGAGQATHCPMRANKEVLSNLTLICPKNTAPDFKFAFHNIHIAGREMLLYSRC